MTSSTVAEFPGIREALSYVLIHPQQAWAIFVNSASALQALSKPQSHSVNSQLALDTLLSRHTALQHGHQIVPQWIPGHSGIPGNLVADMASRCAHDSPDLSLVPYSRPDAARLIHGIGVDVSSSLWLNPLRYYDKLRGIDPKLQFRVPRDLPRHLETVLPRLHLHVAYTRKYLHIIGLADSPLCA